MNSNIKLRNLYSTKILKNIEKINKSFNFMSKYNKIDHNNVEFNNLKNIYNEKLNNKLNKLVNSSKLLLNFDNIIIQQGGGNKNVNSSHNFSTRSQSQHDSQHHSQSLVKSQSQSSIQSLVKSQSQHDSQPLAKQFNNEYKIIEESIKHINEKLSSNIGSIEQIVKKYNDLCKKNKELSEEMKKGIATKLHESNEKVKQLKNDLNNKINIYKKKLKEVTHLFGKYADVNNTNDEYLDKNKFDILHDLTENFNNITKEIYELENIK